MLPKVGQNRMVLGVAVLIFMSIAFLVTGIVIWQAGADSAAGLAGAFGLGSITGAGFTTVVAIANFGGENDGGA